MKPPRFDYRRVTTLDELTQTLRQHGSEAQILAGGQSLVPMLNLRVARPGVLLDINGLSELSRIEATDGRLVLGALTRHHSLEFDPLIARHAPLLALAAPSIAHPAIRHRGTIGGSVALADPAAELPALALCLDARIRLVSSGRDRLVTARDFFLDAMTTAAEPDEAVAAIEFPAVRKGERFAFREIARRHGDFAIAGIAARAVWDEGRLRDVAIAFFGVAARPTLSSSAARLVEDGANATEDFHAAIAGDVEIAGDDSYPADYRLTLAAVLAKRAAADLLAPIAA